jgi:hypothetical protein
MARDVKFLQVTPVVLVVCNLGTADQGLSQEDQGISNNPIHTAQWGIGPLKRYNQSVMSGLAVKFFLLGFETIHMWDVHIQLLIFLKLDCSISKKFNLSSNK